MLASEMFGGLINGADGAARRKSWALHGLIALMAGPWAALLIKLEGRRKET